MICRECYTDNGEDRGMTGAFSLAPLRPQSTAVFTKSAVVGLGPLPLGVSMLLPEEKRARHRLVECVEAWVGSHAPDPAGEGG